MTITPQVRPRNSAPPKLPDQSQDRKRGSREGYHAFGLLLPTGVLLALVVAWPMIWAVGQSFTSDSISNAGAFVGFDNYTKALWGTQASSFWGSVQTTLLFTFVPLVLEVVLGVGMALIMHHVVRGRGMVRALILIPWAIPTAVATVLWQWMLQPDGIINALTGLDVLWTADPIASRVAIMLIDVWKTTPFIALLVLAGLQVIPDTVYEAARVDGAGAIARFTQITLPLAAPAILVAALFRVLDLLRMYDVPAILTGGANGTATLSLLTVQTAINQVKPGYGSALSTLTFILVFIVALAFITGMGSRLFPDEKGSRA